MQGFIFGLSILLFRSIVLFMLLPLFFDYTY